MKRAPSAFTLVELLIVIAIIGILMSILIPTLSNVQRSARIVACANNLKQIVLAINNFAQDNRDRLYNPGGSGNYTPTSCNGGNNLAGLISPIKYVTRDVGYDPAMPKDFRIHGSGTNDISFYSILPIVGATTTTASNTRLRWTKFSDIPRDKAVVIDVMRLAHNLNHPARNGPPTYNLAFADGSVKSIEMAREAYAHYKALGGSANQWHVHNDLVRTMELIADGKDPSRAPGIAAPWPWAASPNTTTHFYIPRYGGPTKAGKAHALSDD